MRIPSYRHRQVLYLSIAWGVFYLGFAAPVWAQGGTGRYPPPPPSKKTPKAKPGPPATVTASGEVRPVRYVTLASETAGRVQRIIVNPGDLVKKNQSLVEIDSSEQSQAAVEQAAINEAE